MDCPNCEAELIDVGTEMECPNCDETVEFTTTNDDDYDFVV